MPATYSMTWEPKPRRWRKMYKGSLYTVSCESLGVPENKEASYRAANAWWREKKAEIDRKDQQPPHPQARDIDISRRMAERYEREGDTENAKGYREMARGMEDNPTLPSLLDIGRVFGVFTHKHKLGVDMTRASKEVIDNILFNPRMLDEVVEAVPEDKTANAISDSYLALKRALHEANQLSASEYDLTRLCLVFFCDWYGKHQSLESLSTDRWESYYKHVLASKASQEYKKKRLRHAREFIEWAAEKGVLTAPSNLFSRKHKIKKEINEVPTVPIPDVRILIDQASDRLRLHLLLMINCGFYQEDISSLRQDKVDWANGTVTRKRSKTSTHSKAPTVTYKLWPITFELLKKFRSNDPVRVLTTEKGGPLLREWLNPEGKKQRADAIKSNYVHLLRRTGFKYPLKWLRKTSSSLLKSSKEFGATSNRFLAHSPRGVEEESYSRPSDSLFDEAVEWLGKQYGFVPE